MIFCFFFSSSLLRAVNEKSEVVSLFKEANALFQQANQAALKDPLKAKKLYQEAALKYQFLVRKHGVVTPFILMNLGNAYYFSGDKGRALINYYHAAQLDPLNRDIRHNLQFVRSECVDEVKETFLDKVVEKLFFWHFFPFEIRVILFAIAYIMMWFFMVVRLFKDSKALKISTYSFFILSLIFVLSIITSNMHLFSSVDGVITSKEAQAYQGDAYIYNQAFLTPIHAGTEFELKERRGDWYYISLADGSNCWIPSKDAELIGSY